MDKKAANPKAPTEDTLMKTVTMNSSIFTKKLLIILVLTIVFGTVTGYMLAKRGGSETLTSEEVSSSSISKGTIVGSDDTKIFKDITEGVLKGGGINGEGQFHLVRPGGDSQNVYLTSSAVDLSKFIAKKIKVWGETQKAQHAGWLMDVGRVEVLE
ncbi:MAG: hypothetical protein HYT07_01615 [Candidatus Levybacteria bacterium]|nr:hypothetical protein [Candidatus Levybacteria bacterium]